METVRKEEEEEEEEEKDLSPTLAKWHETDAEERSWDWDLQEGNVCVPVYVCVSGGWRLVKRRPSCWRLMVKVN